jgi:hypothetical protein
MKADLMAALNNAFRAIPQIRQVTQTKHWPMLNDVAVAPALYFFTGSEKSTRKDELIVEVSMDLVVGVYINLGPAGPPAYYDKADPIQEAIENVLYSLIRPDLAGAYFSKMHTWTWDNHIPNDTTGILGLTVPQLTYYHAWGAASATL